MLVVLRVTAAKDQQLQLAVTGVQLKSGGTWLDLAKDAEIKANYAHFISAGEKGAAALLAKNTQVPKRKYSYFQVLLDSTNTLLVTANGKLPLTLANTALALHDWQPDEKKPWNVLVITVDGTKVVQNADGTSASLPADADRVPYGRCRRRDHRQAHPNFPYRARRSCLERDENLAQFRCAFCAGWDLYHQESARWRVYADLHYPWLSPGRSAER